jgi:hypothetical protein
MGKDDKKKGDKKGAEAAMTVNPDDLMITPDELVFKRESRRRCACVRRTRVRGVRVAVACRLPFTWPAS